MVVAVNVVKNAVKIVAVERKAKKKLDRKNSKYNSSNNNKINVSVLNVSFSVFGRVAVDARSVNI